MHTTSRSRCAATMTIAAFACALAAGRGEAVTFHVTTDGDAGPGSLRQAMLDAEANPGWDAIEFAIPASGLQTIQLLSPLPPLNEQVTIDGSTQGPPADHLVALDGSALGWNGPGLVIGGMGSVLRHLVLHGFGTALRVVGLAIEVTDCRIGTDAEGMVEIGNLVGVHLSGTSHRIARNQISANQNIGVRVWGSGHVIDGNLIGTDRDGFPFAVSPFGQVTGVEVAARANVIANNFIGPGYVGIDLLDAEDNAIFANTIGLAPDGKTPLDLGGHGIHVLGFSDRNVIEGNRIAHTGRSSFGHEAAIRLEAGWADGVDNVVRVNQLHDLPAGALPIDLGNPGLDPNDPGDADTGPNELQNSPVVVDAFRPGGGIVVRGELRSTPHTDYTIDVYTNAGVSTLCEVRAHVGSVQVTTRASGGTRFVLTSPLTLAPGELVSATATIGWLGKLGSTSELSPCVAVQ